MALSFTLLTKEQLYDDTILDVIKKYSRSAAATDLAVFLGGSITKVRNRTIENDLECEMWLASPGYNGDVVCCENGLYVRGSTARELSVRPVLPPEETAKITPNATKRGPNGVNIVLYGEYPQTIADEKTNEALEQLFRSQSLKKTGKIYTFDKNGLGDYSKSFEPDPHPEYEYQGKKYIRVSPRPANNYSRLSDGNYPMWNPWIRVEPIEWLQDPTGTWVSRKCLFSGIQFDTKKYDGHFENTFLKHYLDTYFTRDIVSIERQETIKGLKDKLSEINDLEQVKKTITPARTPERTEKLARIIRVRRAKEILSTAARKAYQAGDQETLNEIVDIARPYARRDEAIRNKVLLKRLENRAKKNR